MYSPEDNPEQAHEPKHHNPTILKRVGRTAVAIVGAYIGIKLGEDIAHLTIPLYEEISVATVVGSVAINARFAAKR